MRVNYAIVFVSDMDRSIAFYREVLGIPVKFESPHWTELATEGSTLALHLGDALDDVDATPHDKLPGHCRPGLAVPDLESFHARMIEHGVRCVQPPTTSFGARIAQYLDPDGLVISVAQHQPPGAK